MFLTELSKLYSINKEMIVEGLVSPELIMMLEKIVKDGKISDMGQITFICKLLQTLNDPSIINTVTELAYKTITSSEMIESIRSLEPEEQVTLAQHLLVILYDRNVHYKYNCEKEQCSSNTSHGWILNFFKQMISSRKRN